MPSVKIVVINHQSQWDYCADYGRHHHHHHHRHHYQDDEQSSDPQAAISTISVHAGSGTRQSAIALPRMQLVLVDTIFLFLHLPYI